MEAYASEFEVVLYKRCVDSFFGGEADYLESFIIILNVERKMAASVKLVATKLNYRQQLSEQHFLISAKDNSSGYPNSYPTLLKERLI